MKQRKVVTSPLVIALALVIARSPWAAGQTTSTAAAPAPNFAEQQKPIFKLMHVEEGWEITRGEPNCVIGVIDTGFDFFHPALAGHIKPGWFAPGVYHTDFFTMDAHGTLVSSLLVAHRQEGQDGMWGFAPGCSVLAAAQGMPVHELLRWRQNFLAKNPNASGAEMAKAMSQTPSLKAFGDHWIEFVFTTLADSIHYLTDHGARVINISEFIATSVLASKPELKARVEEAFNYARDKDVLIVVGAGNSDNPIAEYPGDRDSVMVAGASTLADKRWSSEVSYMGMDVPQGSCYGPRLSVMAPVQGLVVASPHEDSYYSWNDTPIGSQKEKFEAMYEVLPWGATSSATPEVAALAALVRSLRPDLHTKDVIRLIEQGADPIGDEGFHEETGYGRINFFKTLELARAVPDLPIHK